MRFHMTMLFVVFAVAMAMHALANAAGPQPTAGQLAARDAGVRQAGEHLNEDLIACRDKARQDPKASKRDLASCERAAKKQFRAEVREARAN